MAAKKRKKKRRQARVSRQQLLQAHARRFLPELPPHSEIRIEPKGQVKMSEVLRAFVEPYLGLTSTDNGQRMLLYIATAAWNAALLPEEKRPAMLDEVVEKGLSGFPEEEQEELRKLLADMVARKLALFDENKRFILSIELTSSSQGYHLSVVSTPGKS